MKKPLLCLFILLLLPLVACDRPGPIDSTGAPTTEYFNTTHRSDLTNNAGGTADSSAELQQPTQHSERYLPGVPVEDVIRYFNEVCLNAEYVISGNATLVQKWTEPIQYVVYGEPTAEDRFTLSAFTEQLNGISGFPGIHETQNPSQANLRIHFCTREELISLMGGGAQYENMDGAVTFWYNNNQIYDAIICYRTDLDQTLRNSVILEEIYNGLGPIQDSSLRPDSIIYQGFSTPQRLTEMDVLLLQLLYHPEITCGMNAAQCEAVIRRLYY